MKILDTRIAAITIVIFGLSTSCIRPQNYHPNTSIYSYVPQPSQSISGGSPRRTQLNGLYYKQVPFHEAYIEFDASGRLYDRQQAKQAAQLIAQLRGASGNQKVRVFVFIHGWKNNASEDSGNVWAFRRMLNHLAYLFKDGSDGLIDPNVVGVYIGWPGAVSTWAKDLTFWNREDVSRIIGGTELTDVLKDLLHATKSTSTGEYDGYSTAVLIGHSFGGQVLERAYLPILQEEIDSEHVYAPADLVLLLNEAAPAMLSAPFIQELIHRGVDFVADGKSFPLVVSMTSTGDPATKLAFPGGEFISPNRPSTVSCPNEKALTCTGKLDTFGQKSTIAYNLLTTANMLALQSHTFELNAGQQCSRLTVAVGNKHYCIAAAVPPPQVSNNTPYWVMQMPQSIVPDHGSVFRDEVNCVVEAFLADRNEIRGNPVCLSGPQIQPGVEALQARALPVTAVKPKLNYRSRSSAP